MLPALYDSLDGLVLNIYGWRSKDDVLTNLLDLNVELADSNADGHFIVAQSIHAVNPI
jgi:hypothetical protein